MAARAGIEPAGSKFADLVPADGGLPTTGPDVTTVDPMSSFLRFSCAVIAGAMSCSVATRSGAADQSPPVAEPLRVMSFNVRTSTAQDGADAWPHRKDFLIETIARFGPTLIGFQEVREDQHDEIIARMSEYAFSGVARDDGKRTGEWCLIGYRRDRFAVVRHGDFWLSEQPEVPGSKSWDAALTRLCSWVRLRETATGRELVYANTHFDHKGVIARREASRVLSEQLAKIAAACRRFSRGI